MTWTGRRRPSAEVITPPFDCMTSTRRADAERRQLVLEAAEVLVHDRQHVGVGDGRAGALELADLGQQLGRQRQRARPGARSRTIAATACSWRPSA